MFDSNPAGNGAEKREAQIDEILKRGGVDYVLVKKESAHSVSLMETFLKSIPTIVTMKQLVPLWHFKGFRSLLRNVRNYLATKKILSNELLGESGVLLWECTRSDNFFVPLLAKKYKKSLVVLPHNLESLVPNQSSSVSLKKSPDWFREEISYLSVSDMCFCVSKEETLLLRQFGISSAYFPYYPTKDVESFYLQIRKERSILHTHTRRLKKLVMLGSANNQPTRIGMIDRIRFFSKNRLEGAALLVAGFHTESLAEYVTPADQINLLGTLDVPGMRRLLIEADAILIHQPATSGAVNRIPEMLVAGLPIFLNFESARNYYGLDGVYVYEDDDQLLRLLANASYSIPNLPHRPAEEESRFVNYLKSLQEVTS